MIERRFTITNGSNTRLVVPLDFKPKESYSYTNNLDDGQLFFRKQLTKELIFVNGDTRDFDYFKQIHQYDGSRCAELKILIEVNYAGIWREEWRGVFSTGRGKWDFSKCIFKVKPDVDDDYKCLLDEQETEVNIMGTPTRISSSTFIFPDYEYYVCRGSLAVSQGAFYGNCSTHLPLPDNGWTLLHAGSNHYDRIAIWIRERIVVACQGGVAAAPASGTWELILDDCVGSDTSTWVREPQNYTVPTQTPGSPGYYPNPDVYEGDCTSSSGGVAIIPPPREYLPVKYNDEWDALTPHNMIIWGWYNFGALALTDTHNFLLLNFPAGSTFAWTLDADAGAMGFSFPGSTTNNNVDVLGIYTFFLGMPSTGMLTCEITTPCGGFKTISHPIFKGSDTSFPARDNTKVIGPTQVCAGQTGVVFSVPDKPSGSGHNINWTLLPGAKCVIVGPSNTNVVTVDINANATPGDIGLRMSGPGDPINSIRAVVAKPPKTGEITGCQSACEGDFKAYSVYNRTGSTYDWIVEGGATLIAGQGTNEILVEFTDDTENVLISVKETLDGCACSYLLVADCVDGAPPYYWCNQSSSITFSNNILLMEAIEYMLQQMGCSIEEVVSDFFEYNPLYTVPGSSPGINYVTAGINNHNMITISQKSDIKFPGNTEVATKGILTFKDLMFILREVWNVWWKVENGKLRLEHKDAFDLINGLDLTAAHYERMIAGKNSYTSKAEGAPKYEKFTWMEGLHTDFVGFNIRYDNPCVNPALVVEHVVGKITTDLSYIYTDPDDISNDGFVLMANYDNSGSIQVIIDVGAFTGDSLPNMPLSWANLHRDFHKSFRYQRIGFMNNALTDFYNLRNTIEQDEISIQLPQCVDILDFDPSNKIKTPLGELHLGQLRANVQSAEFVVLGNTLKLKLGYSY